MAFFSLVSPSFAGGGPENVFLIVNSSSQASKTVANHYTDIRNIPASNIFYVEFDEERWIVTSSEFKSKILFPALEAMNERGIRGQIDYVIYSCGFPWTVSFVGEFPDVKFSSPFQPYGSLTGSTYLWAFAKEKRKEIFALSTNFYCSPKPDRKLPKIDLSMTRGFRGSYGWLPNGKRANQGGLPYYLSAMLGVSSGSGNTAEEIVRYLRIAKKADETHPKGTVYYMRHGGPRSKPRHHLFPQAVSALKQAGINAKVLEGRFPTGKQDVLGLTVGVTQFNIPNSKNRILPGALCDNLTSSGGYFKLDGTQTPATKFLVHGAAGASGTVIEPGAIPHKFPTPFLHLHYVRGCSMAEAFYQSINAPFQQIIVGDPLCQPWAEFPEVSVSGIPSGKFVKGSILLVPSSASKGKNGVSVFELFIDGVRRQRCRPGGTFSLDTTTVGDGYHELRVVAIDDSLIETQGRWITGIEVNNQKQAILLFLENRQNLAGKKLVTIKVTSTLKSKVLLLHNGREVGTLPTGSGKVRLSTETLGSGPIVIQAHAQGENSVLSAPLRFELSALPPNKAPAGSVKVGILDKN